MQTWEVCNRLVAGGYRSRLLSCPGVVQFHVRFSGHVGLHGVANSGHSNWWSHEFCCSGCRLGWLGQPEEHLKLAFHFRERAVRSCILWRRCVDDVLAGSHVFCCSCIFVDMRACYPVPLSLVSGAKHDCPHLGRCGIARRWAARCGQHKEPELIVGAQSWTTAKVDFPSLDWSS